MTFSSCLTDQDKVIVLDASVIINLLATQNARAILQTFDASFIVTGNVVQELERGVINGSQKHKLVVDLINAQVLRMEELTGASVDHFFEMVSGSTPDTLGDGEAATLAFASSNGFTAAIDEKKATRIAGERFEFLKLATTVDILAFKTVQESLGFELLSNATLHALRNTRMQVRHHQFEWIVQLIGEHNLATCPSLKKLAKQRMLL